jgi:signal transduction histidine kinase
LTAPAKGPLRGPGIGRLILSVNLFVLLVPIMAVLMLRIYDQHLVQQTERRLIAESVLIGEAWRSALLTAKGQSHAGAIEPADQPHATFFPIEPVIDLHAALAPNMGDLARRPVDPTRPEVVAGQAIKPLLDRAKRVNLSGARVLDAQGCVVASTADRLDQCYTDLPEVRLALQGRYHAVARDRDSDGPRPPITAISRGNQIRVFTATPLFSNGAVIGVVRMSRTPLDAPKALWRYRYTLLWGLLGCLGLTLAISLFLRRTLIRPVRAITAAAEAIAQGAPRRPLPDGRVPAEVFQLSAALDEMTEQLRARAAYVADFAANVSHELKTPLTGVRGAVELLREDWAEMEPEQRARFLANIDADADRMQRLVTRLLHLARIEHAPPEAQALEVDQILHLLTSRLDVPVELTIDPTTPRHIMMAPEHFVTAVGNLLDNAARHGAGKPIEVTSRGDGTRLVVTVRDHGPGISPRNQSRIFDRFFTTERDHGGTGLGLALVQAIARTRKGDVGFETGPDGTTFTLRI